MHSPPSKVRQPPLRDETGDMPATRKANRSPPHTFAGDTPTYAGVYEYSGDNEAVRTGMVNIPPPSQMGNTPQQRMPEQRATRGGPAMHTRPPSYTGSRSEELLLMGQAAGGPNVERRRVMQQATKTTGARPQTARGSPPTNKKPAGAFGDPVQRLKTPSVVDSVLHPLSQKVAEYDSLMHAARDDMERLDDELRALQTKRDEAEGRFLEAQARHNDWRRQYGDVERALKGDVPCVTSPPMHATQRQPGPQVAMHGEHDDDVDFPEPGRRPASHQDSFGSSRSKVRTRDRLRKSFFGLP